MREDNPPEPRLARWRHSNTIHAKDAATMSGERDGATSGTTTMGAADAADAVEVGTADRAAASEAAAVDADDGTAATNAARGATWHDDSATCKHDDAAAMAKKISPIIPPSIVLVLYISMYDLTTYR